MLTKSLLILVRLDFKACNINQYVTINFALILRSINLYISHGNITNYYFKRCL